MARGSPRGALRISPRQDEILELMAAGQPDKEIARRLQISRATVRTYIDRFYRAHGVHNRVEAVAIWLTLRAR